jgi:hypothetical protein
MSRLYSTKMAMQGAKAQARAKALKKKVQGEFLGMGPEERKYGRPMSAAGSFDYFHALRMGQIAHGQLNGIKGTPGEVKAKLRARAETDAMHRGSSVSHVPVGNPAPRKRAGVMRKAERSVDEIQRELELLQGTRGTSKRVKTLKLELTLAQGGKDVTKVAPIKVTNT